MALRLGPVCNPFVNRVVPLSLEMLLPRIQDGCVRTDLARHVAEITPDILEGSQSQHALSGLLGEAQVGAARQLLDGGHERGAHAEAA